MELNRLNSNPYFENKWELKGDGYICNNTNSLVFIRERYDDDVSYVWGADVGGMAVTGEDKQYEKAINALVRATRCLEVIKRLRKDNAVSWARNNVDQTFVVTRGNSMVVITFDLAFSCYLLMDVGNHRTFILESSKATTDKIRGILNGDR